MSDEYQSWENLFLLTLFHEKNLVFVFFQVMLCNWQHREKSSTFHSILPTFQLSVSSQMIINIYPARVNLHLLFWKSWQKANVVGSQNPRQPKGKFSKRWPAQLAWGKGESAEEQGPSTHSIAQSVPDWCLLRGVKVHFSSSVEKAQDTSARKQDCNSMTP